MSNLSSPGTQLGNPHGFNTLTEASLRVSQKQDRGALSSSERSSTMENSPTATARFKELHIRLSRSSQDNEISSNVAQRSLRDNENGSPAPLSENPAAFDQTFSAQLPKYDDEDASSQSRTMSVASFCQQDPNPVAATYQPVEHTNGMFLQPETHPITEEQLVNEVRAIYAGLVMVEKKCIEIVKQQNENPGELTILQWQALTALHRTLLHEHFDFFLASNHPAASDALKGLAKAYSMPARMWRYGIHAFLELLRKKLPLSLEHMLTFIYMAHAMMTLLLESVPQFKETWIECLGDLARYRMAIEEVDMRDREIYTGVARYWYTKAADLNPDIGRVQHHLAVLARPNVLQQLFYYSKALVSVQPFTNARESILLLFGPLLDPAKAATKYSRYYPQVLTIFVEAHGILFTRQDIPTFLRLGDEFLSQLDRHAGMVGPLFREQGVYIMASNYAAIFDFGHDDAEIAAIFNQAELSQETKLEILDKAYHYWQSPSCRQIGIDLRASKDAKISSSGEAVSLASHFAFTTLDVILDRLGDRNTLPSVHVSLAFLWCLAMVPESMNRIQADVPWDRLATYMNTLITPDTDMSEIENAEFPAQESGPSRQLPEDSLIHGLSWGRLCHPPGFFGEMAEDDERSIELPSVIVPRTRRCLWLGMQIAKFNCWLIYDSENRKFCATQFAHELATLSRQHQLLRQTPSAKAKLPGQHRSLPQAPSTQADTDIEMAEA
uniref:DNA/RNA-binding domain-containing protein n=1 Tax=Talaromyces marneffei PM1 TaxID=1077442 RepID=A0A093X721_TALMA